MNLVGIAEPRILRIDVPVAWQLTRTLVLGKGSTTLTESFRETWTLEITPNGLVNLQSPRARVPAYASAQALRTLAPHALALREADFARLVGVEPLPTADNEEADNSPVVTNLIMISLLRSARGGSDVNLNWSEDGHYTVHFEVGTQGSL